MELKATERKKDYSAYWWKKRRSLGDYKTMKKEIVVIFVLALFLLSACSTGEATRQKILPAYDDSKCIDSDNGINLEEKGLTQGKYYWSFAAKEDYCDSGNRLIEFYCGRSKIQKTIKDCKILGENYKCEEGKCFKPVKLKNRVDTLVIVDTDSFPELTEEDVQDLFKLAEDYWLFPKTQTKFNILDVVYFSLAQNEWSDLLIEYFQEGDKVYPEYVVVFKEELVYGGHVDVFNPKTDFEEEMDYCMEFKYFAGNSNNAKKVVPGAIVNYGHRYGICGYGDDLKTIVSDVSLGGQCKNTDGIPCVWKNGYQMCSNLANDFFAQNNLLLSAKTIVHELLHYYSNDIAYEHFSTLCAFEKLGWDPDKSWNYYLETLPAAEPFDSITVEYAGICPTTWQDFIDSKQDCGK
ncbi:hypothetical protein ISS05_05710 [Candidatus Woesearchaeota archaeon]|nr:hypothetical protein [Candidatus Woesearchaeota archaeon]